MPQVAYRIRPLFGNSPVKSGESGHYIQENSGNATSAGPVPDGHEVGTMIARGGHGKIRMAFNIFCTCKQMY